VSPQERESSCVHESSWVCELPSPWEREFMSSQVHEREWVREFVMHWYMTLTILLISSLTLSHVTVWPDLPTFINGKRNENIQQIVSLLQARIQIFTWSRCCASLTNIPETLDNWNWIKSLAFLNYIYAALWAPHLVWSFSSLDGDISDIWIYSWKTSYPYPCIGTEIWPLSSKRSLHMHIKGGQASVRLHVKPKAAISCIS